MWMWVVPAAVIVVSAAPIAVLLRGLARETARLADQVRTVRELRPALVELRDETRTVRAQLHHLRSSH